MGWRKPEQQDVRMSSEKPPPRGGRGRQLGANGGELIVRPTDKHRLPHVAHCAVGEDDFHVRVLVHLLQPAQERAPARLSENGDDLAFGQA